METLKKAPDPLKPLGSNLETLIRRILDLNHEVRVANKIFVSSAYGVGYKETLAGAAQWSDITSDPVADIRDALSVPLQTPNQITMSQEVWDKLSVHPKVAKAIYPTLTDPTGAVVTSANFLNLFRDRGLEKINIGKSRVQTSSGLQRAWGKHCLLHYTNPSPALETPTFAMTFSETQSAIIRDFDKKRGLKGAEYIKDAWNEDVKITASKSAYFFENAVA